MVFATQAQALSITPNQLIDLGDQTSQNVIHQYIIATYDAYELDFGGGDDGVLAGSYNTTTFSGDPPAFGAFAKPKPGQFPGHQRNGAQPVTEPGTILLLGLVLVGIAGMRMRIIKK
jgi:hypothetical protein